MSETKFKLKGCRSIEDCRLDYTNVAARLGAGIFRIGQIQADCKKFEARLAEIQLELDEATKQEKQQESTEEPKLEMPNLEVVQ